LQANEKFNNDLSVARAQTIQEMQNQNAAALRAQQVAATQGQLQSDASAAAPVAAQGIINKQFSGVNPLPTDTNGNPVQSNGQAMPQAAIDAYNQGASTIADAKSSALDNATQQAQAAYLQDPRNLLKAKAEAGYGGEEAAAQNVSKQDISQLKYEELQQRTQDQLANMRAITTMQINAGRYDKGGSAKDTTIHDTIASLDNHRKSLNSQLTDYQKQLDNTNKSDPDYSQLVANIAGIHQQMAQIDNGSAQLTAALLGNAPTPTTDTSRASQFKVIR
jgi:hypothetical protein